MIRRSWILALALAVPACGASGQSRRSGGAPEGIPIDVTAPQRITVQRRVHLTGTLASPDEATISSEVAGVVRQVLIELGQEVRRGQVLVTLDQRELALELQRAESALRQTEAQLGVDSPGDRLVPPDDEIASVRAAMANHEDAKAQFARAEQLAARGLLSRVERDTAETRLEVAEATYQSALEHVRSLKASLQDRRAALELARKRLGDGAIRAPVDGSVAERSARPGTFVPANTPVAVLMQLDPLRLVASVQERFADVIKPGMPVQFHVEPFGDTTFDGRIAHISPAVNRDTRSFTVEAVVDNHDRRLKPGFFAQGAVLTHADDRVIAVSEDAISTLSGVSSVFVVDGAKVRQRRVVLGEQQGTFVEIVEGLDGTERVAASNLNRLATDVAVIVHVTAANAASR